jgi:hypothetical protein
MFVVLLVFCDCVSLNYVFCKFNSSFRLVCIPGSDGITNHTTQCDAQKNVL